jgi:hypothetical protein
MKEIADGKNNGYVVLKRKKLVVRGRVSLRPPPTLFAAGF